MRELRVRLANAASFPPEVDNLALTHHLDSLMRPVGETNADDDDFDLSAVFHRIGVVPAEQLFVDWYRYDRVDEIAYGELARYFHELWYPSSDDITLFDDSCSWLIAIDHSGCVACVVFSA